MIPQSIHIHVSFGISKTTNEHLFKIDLTHNSEPQPYTTQVFGPYKDEKTCVEQADINATETRDMLMTVFGYQEIQVH